MKSICQECGWVGDSDAMLKAQHPFDRLEICYGCPNCLSIDSAVGRALRIDHAYLHRLANGKKTNPSSSILRKLGLDADD